MLVALVVIVRKVVIQKKNNDNVFFQLCFIRKLKYHWLILSHFTQQQQHCD